ncbi:hypothetical protein CHISP_0451 [Chitinispirillum alkaliphilum]|nr:hypothetical protein CHISP_0451 [Chitinispirillum alkaliphilum]
MANKKRKKSFKSSEMDLKPFMNLMVVLIPMLLVTSEFARISIIDIRLPESRGSQPREAVTERDERDESNKLILTAIVTDSLVTLAARGGFLPSLYYNEYHRYICRVTMNDTLVRHVPGEMPHNPYRDTVFTKYERDEIFLYTTDEDGEVLETLYSRYREMITDVDGTPVRSVSAGDTVYALTNPRRMIVVNDPSEFTLQPLSAYDELTNRLMRVKDRHPDADDIEDIIIAAENYVIYDKIIQIMDAARAADFPNISISKLRS